MRRPTKEQFAAILEQFAQAKREKYWLIVNLTDDQINKATQDGVPQISAGGIAYEMAVGFLCRVMDVRDLPEKYQQAIPNYIMEMDEGCKASLKVAGYTIRTPADLYKLITTHYLDQEEA